jgi:2-polyprenyl-6-methoxyphenol hydroxylase-like FAD-dependent oxidoreductase
MKCANMNMIFLGIEVIWDAQVKSFEEIDDKVHIHFVDSTKHQTEVADLLIGADGTHSPIRKQLTGDIARPAGFNAVVGLIKKEADGSNDDLFEHELINNSGVLVSGRNGKK